jgi:hypothetical protein
MTLLSVCVLSNYGCMCARDYRVLSHTYLSPRPPCKRNNGELFNFIMYKSRDRNSCVRPLLLVIRWYQTHVRANNPEKNAPWVKIGNKKPSTIIHIICRGTGPILDQRNTTPTLCKRITKRVHNKTYLFPMSEEMTFIIRQQEVWGMQVAAW